jgi:hypothetical protein
MALTEKPKYIKEPTDLQCGQAVIAMLADKTALDIVNLLKNEKETTLKEMFYALEYYDISYDKQRIEVKNKEQLPKVAILSLETPRCWHWSLYFDGVFYDPEHGVMKDFPESKRKYYWEIKENVC